MDGDLWHGGLVARLSPPLRTKLLAMAHSFHYDSGQWIFREGDPSRHFYVVKSGHVALEASLGEGEPGVFMMVAPGDCFSWSALLESPVETASARAVEDVEVLGIESRALQDLCWAEPNWGVELHRKVLQLVSERLIATRKQLSDVDSATVAKEMSR